jgi:polyisoprenoid-binding protein YceI
VPGANRAATAFADPSVAPANDAGLDGGWKVGPRSQAGYSIDDTVMGQSTRVVGRTSDVTGTMALAGTTVTATHVVVNMQTVTCHCVHDVKYRQLLETDKYPTSTFDLTKPIVLPSIPAQGVVITVPVTGNFTIHGVTRSVNFTMKATRTGARVAVNGSVPVNLKDYNVQQPSAGSMGGIGDCDIDLLLAFDHTA